MSEEPDFEMIEMIVSAAIKKEHADTIAKVVRWLEREAIADEQANGHSTGKHVLQLRARILRDHPEVLDVQL